MKIITLGFPVMYPPVPVDELPNTVIKFHFRTLEPFEIDLNRVREFNCNLAVILNETGEVGMLQLAVGLEIPDDELEAREDRDFSTFSSMGGEVCSLLDHMELQIDQIQTSIDLIKSKFK